MRPRHSARWGLLLILAACLASEAAEKPADRLSWQPGTQNALLGAPDRDFVDLSRLANGDARGSLSSLGVNGWFETSEITANGIPFRVLTADKNVLQTGMEYVGAREVPAAAKGCELFLLLLLNQASIAPAAVQPEFVAPGARQTDFVDDVEGFIIELEYKDASVPARVDKVFPTSFPEGIHRITSGLGVYRVPLRPDAELVRVRLVDRMRKANFALAGLTLNTSGKALGRCSEMPPPYYQLKERAALPASAATVTVTDESATLSNGVLTLVIGLRPKLGIRSVQSRYFGDSTLNKSASPLFAVQLGKTVATSEDFRLDSVEKTPTGVTLQCSGPATPVPLRARIGAGFEGEEILFRLDLLNSHTQPVRMTVTFPIFKDVVLGTVEDTWYLYMQRWGIVHNAPFHGRLAHSGAHPTQVTDLFSPAAGAGLCFMSKDVTNTRPFYDLEKNDAGASYQLHWTEQEVAPGGACDLSPAGLSAHAGDWRAALRAYKSWLDSWYKPAAPRKPWFRSAFLFRQMWIEWMYDRQTDTYDFRKAIAREEQMFGPVDWANISNTLVQMRPGEYATAATPEQLAKLRRAFADLKQTVPVSIYVDGYDVDGGSEVGREHGAQWTRIQANGVPAGRKTGKVFSLCPAVVAWQDCLSNIYKKIVEQIAPSGVYVDVYGWCWDSYACYSAAHGHRVPEPPNRGEREMMRKVREAVGPDVAIWTEETPPDCNSMFQDGSFSHFGFPQNRGALVPHLASLYRFCFPDFACIEVVSGGDFPDGRWSALKSPFFNGLGYWIFGPAEKYEPECRAFIRKVCGILRAHKDAFAGTDFTPVVPTLMPGVYCNRFDSPAETVWTFYNARFETARGPVLAVPAGAYESYLDAWNGRPLSPEKDSLCFETDPRGVMCVVGKRKP